MPSNLPVKIYTESCTDGELTLVARSYEELLGQINADLVDTENCFLVTEHQLTEGQREDLIHEQIKN